MSPQQKFAILLKSEQPQDRIANEWPGGKVGKRLRVTRILVNGTYGNPQTYQQVPTSVDLNSTYTYDNEGRTTAMQYPSHDAGTAGPNLGWAFDTMGRLNTMTDLATQFGIITGSTYGPSNELLTMAGQSGETRTYNSMLQLTSLVGSASSGQSVNITYAYSSTQNNGKITSQTDNISGEQVQYTYDALNRLATAKATSNAWGQSYSYDGFGNLTDQNVIAGSAPTYHVVPSPTTNRVGSTDANGNTTGSGNYDIENRLIGYGGTAGPYGYSYAPGNKRVWRGVWTSGTLTTDEITFWSVGGQKLATYGLYVLGGIINQSSNPAQLIATQTGTSYYFGSKLIKNTGGYLAKDRLGSIGHFYPYGQEKPSATQNGTEKFTGYFRDAETGQDYADQRYHSPGTGRFMTPDPYMASADGSADVSNPGSWNHYGYAGGDPITFFDPEGLFQQKPGDPPPNNCKDPTNPSAACGPTIRSAPLPRQSRLPGAAGGGGIGAVTVQKSYDIDTKCSKSAASLTADIENNFSSFANYTGSFDGLSTSLAFVPPSGGIAPGAVVQIPHTTLGMTVTDSVTVTDANATSFTFATNPGHPLNATISFTAQDMGNGLVGFDISINGQTANAFWSAFFAAGGSSFEDDVWNHFLDSVIADCSTRK